jgi:cellulose synthase/poly-beta-1,6-N-acetylglucosamine synthase-like glycosyltransferase
LLKPQVIAVLDADMVALPQIYTTLLPYLGQDEANAIVQSPQNWCVCACPVLVLYEEFSSATPLRCIAELVAKHSGAVLA